MWLSGCREITIITLTKRQFLNIDYTWIRGTCSWVKNTRELRHAWRTKKTNKKTGTCHRFPGIQSHFLDVRKLQKEPFNRRNCRRHRYTLVVNNRRLTVCLSTEDEPSWPILHFLNILWWLVEDSDGRRKEAGWEGTSSSDASFLLKVVWICDG